MKIINAMDQMISFSKVLIFGETGTGKSSLAIKLAVGLIEQFKLNPHIVFYDTERRAKAVINEFTNKNIKTEIVESRSLKDLFEFFQYCEKNNAIGIEDNDSHVWQYMMENYLSKKNIQRRQKGWNDQKRLYLQDWLELKPEWVRYNDAPFLSTKAHIIKCARTKNVFEEFEEKQGDRDTKTIVNVGTAPRTETNSAYEPYLIIELFRELNIDFNPKKDTKKYFFSCVVTKDNFHATDGKYFENPKFENFLPHFQKLDINIKQNEFDLSGHDDLFQDQDGNFEEKQKTRKIVLENISDGLTIILPGTGERIKAKKRKIIETITGQSSWIALENADYKLLKLAETVINELKKIHSNYLEIIDNAEKDKRTEEQKSIIDFFESENLNLIDARVKNICLELTK